ncbi:MAG: alginate export family protein [Bacteroidota bacterium]|nr:alginate export family protein [Bacteroidota bacterium]
MKAKLLNNAFGLSILCALVFVFPAKAQFSIGGELLQRGEFRSGYGKLISRGSDPAAFVGQRFRLQANYKLDKVTLFASVQDVRTWGSTSQLNSSDGFLSLHEGWGEIHFDSCWSAKIGRQELNYDNLRFLGSSDWNLQGRSHDFALVKYEKNKLKIHFGAGYNQNAEALSGNIFSITSQYKTAQMLRCEDKFGKLEMGIIFWNNGKQFTVLDTANVITDKGIRYSQTIGVSTLKYQLTNTTFSAFYYHQVGKDVNNKNMNAYDAGFQVSQLFNANEEKKNQVRITLGGEMISGTKSNNTGNNNNSFSALYGTNHMHNGYMDMFYVAGRNENSTGLNDIFLLAKYELTSSLFISVNGHYFTTNADYFIGAEKQKSQLGTEADATIGFVLNKSVSFQAGYSQMFAQKTLEKIQAISNPQNIQNWAYLMIIIRPDSDKKFIGLVF